MKLDRYSLMAAAAIMAATPALAAPANPAASLSLSKSVRVGSPTASKDKLAGGGFFIAAIAIVAVIAGVIIIADSDDDSDSD